jgi:hypothetical protein
LKKPEKEGGWLKQDRCKTWFRRSNPGNSLLAWQCCVSEIFWLTCTFLAFLAMSHTQATWGPWWGRADLKGRNACLLAACHHVPMVAAERRDCWARCTTEKGLTHQSQQKAQREGGPRGMVALSTTAHRALLDPTPEVADFFRLVRGRMAENDRSEWCSYEPRQQHSGAWVCFCLHLSSVFALKCMHLW